jgi:hypothetical protein
MFFMNTVDPAPMKAMRGVCWRAVRGALVIAGIRSRLGGCRLKRRRWQAAFGVGPKASAGRADGAGARHAASGRAGRQSTQAVPGSTRAQKSAATVRLSSTTVRIVS